MAVVPRVARPRAAALVAPTADRPDAPMVALTGVPTAAPVGPAGPSPAVLGRVLARPTASGCTTGTTRGPAVAPEDRAPPAVDPPAPDRAAVAPVVAVAPAGRAVGVPTPRRLVR
jgi:hypothetical protein